MNNRNKKNMHASRGKNGISKKKIAVIGSGVVGKATGKGFMRFGHDVTFVDIDSLAIEPLSREGYKTTVIGDLRADQHDVYLVNVLTPTINDKFESRFIISAMATLGKIIRHNSRWSVIVIRSTVPPGTIENVLIPVIQKYSGKKAGKDFGVAMNPEFLREASAEEDFLSPRLVVIGSNDLKTATFMNELYQSFGVPIFHMTIKEAEVTKYVHNLYNANKISFFNEMRTISEEVGADTEKVFHIVSESAEASWNKKYGIKKRGPFEGSCLPKDTRAFLSWADEHMNKKLPLLHAIIEVNEQMKDKHYFNS